MEVTFKTRVQMKTEYDAIRKYVNGNIKLSLKIKESQASCFGRENIINRQRQTIKDDCKRN